LQSLEWNGNLTKDAAVRVWQKQTNHLGEYREKIAERTGAKAGAAVEVCK
jgi:hypothetical protein